MYIIYVWALDEKIKWEIACLISSCLFLIEFDTRWIRAMSWGFFLEAKSMSLLEKIETSLECKTCGCQDPWTLNHTCPLTCRVRYFQGPLRSVLRSNIQIPFPSFEFLDSSIPCFTCSSPADWFTLHPFGLSQRFIPLCCFSTSLESRPHHVHQAPPLCPLHRLLCVEQLPCLIRPTPSYGAHSRLLETGVPPRNLIQVSGRSSLNPSMKQMAVQDFLFSWVW